MTTPPIDLEAEKQEILRRYRGLLRAAKLSKSRADRRAIRKAFDISLEAPKLVVNRIVSNHSQRPLSL